MTFRRSVFVLGIVALAYGSTAGAQEELSKPSSASAPSSDDPALARPMTLAVLPQLGTTISPGLRLDVQTAPMDPISPLAAVALKRGLLTQERNRIDLAVAARYRAWGYEGASAEVISTIARSRSVSAV